MRCIIEWYQNSERIIAEGITCDFNFTSDVSKPSLKKKPLTSDVFVAHISIGTYSIVWLKTFKFQLPRKKDTLNFCQASLEQ